MRRGDVILVVDIGGGTTDLSLIAVLERDGDLELHRVAVGDHILLGGDNMDLALAYGVTRQAGARAQDSTPGRRARWPMPAVAPRRRCCRTPRWSRCHWWCRAEAPG